MVRVPCTHIPQPNTVYASPLSVLFPRLIMSHNLSFPQPYPLPLFSMTTGTSPYHVSTPTPGRYSLLVMAEHGGQSASLLLWFEVLPASGRLEVTAIQRSISSNASVLVEFAANRLGTEFQCSTGDQPFQICEWRDGAYSHTHTHILTSSLSHPHTHLHPHILTSPLTLTFLLSHPHTHICTHSHPRVLASAFIFS